MRHFLILLAHVMIYSSTSAQSLSFVAHRGASYLAPENTMESIKLAWELNADGAECDVMLTQDNKIILFHDNTGERLLGKDVTIKETSYRNLKNWDVKLRETNRTEFAGARIPLLKDILKQLPKDQLLVIEIKCGPEIIPFMQKTLQKYWKSGRIAFIAFGYETIIQTKATFPEIPCYYLSSTIEDVDQRFDDLVSSDLEGVDLNHKIIDKNLVDRFRQHGKEVWCWTVNTPEDAERMRAAGVQYVTTDRPAWLKEQVDAQ